MGPDADASKPSSLRQAKQALRGRVLAARDALPSQVRASQGAAIRERLQALPSFAGASTVLVTLPFRSEWDTLPLARDALRAGKRVVVPRVDPASRTLHLHAVGDLEADVVPGYLGVPEPRVTCPAVQPTDVEWALVPGVAFDAAGRRLGYGGGFFDRLLPLIPATAPRIAGAFDVQVVEEVPAHAHDQRVDAIASPSRLLTCPAR